MCASTSTPEIVEAHDLRKRFGQTEALTGVELSIKTGVIFAIVGPDGAGKTTLLRILSGVMRPDSGSLHMVGHDAAADPERVKGEIGYLSQRFSLNQVLTVEENIEFFASLYKVPRSQRGPRIRRLLEFSRLGPFKERRTAQLSGGMKQKLSLCCALVHTPQLLLLDEPTTGVDPISRRELWDILYGLLGEGVTVVLSTPYMDEAERATDIMLLHHGRGIATGSLSELRSRFRHSVFELIARDNRAAHRLLSEKLGKRRVVFFGQKLHLVLDKADDFPAVKNLLDGSGLAVESALEVSPGLEDIFIQEISDEQNASA
jgi:ABC-2 type transport system ATP-binding protein